MTHETAFVASPADRLCRNLAALTIADQPLTTTLQQVAQLVHRLLPPALFVSVAVLDGRGRCTFAVSDPLAAVLDERQYCPENGPGMAAAATGQVVEVEDTERDDLFGEFSGSAARSGVRWVFSVPVPVAEPVRASVTAYGTGDALCAAHRDPLTDLAPRLAPSVFNSVSYAAAVERAGYMQRAMASRATIEQAKGIIMSVQHCTADQAFALLRDASIRSNRKLRDIAHAMVENTCTS